MAPDGRIFGLTSRGTTCYNKAGLEIECNWPTVRSHALKDVCWTNSGEEWALGADGRLWWRKGAEEGQARVPAEVLGTCQTEGDRLWLATPEDVLEIRLERGTGGRLGVVSRRLGTPLAPPERIYSYLRDRQGSEWIGTATGVSRRIRSRVESVPFTDARLGATVGLIEDRYGAIWAMREWGHIVRIREPMFRTVGDTEGLSSSQIRGVSRLGDDIFVSLTARGVARLRPEQGQADMTPPDRGSLTP